MVCEKEPVFTKILSEINGVEGVVISSTESVCFGQAWKKSDASTAKSYVASTIPNAMESVSKLEWGGLKTIIADFQGGTIVHLCISQVVFTFVGSSSLDLDTITSESMYSRLADGFKPLIDVVSAAAS